MKLDTRIILSGKTEFQVIKLRTEGFTWGTDTLCPSKTEIVTQWVVLKIAG